VGAAAFAARPVAGQAAARPTPNAATVTALSVVPTSGGPDVIVKVAGPVSARDFTLQKPNKIVVDLAGATLGLPVGATYDGVPRDGITQVRYSQFNKNVVRIVIVLTDGPHEYDTAHENGELHIEVTGAGKSFDPWSVGAAATTVAANAKPAPSTTPAANTKPAAPPTTVAANKPAPTNTPAPTAAPAATQKPTAPVSQPAATEKPAPSAVAVAEPPVRPAAEPPSLAAEPPRMTPVAQRTTPAVQQQREPCITVNFEASPISDVLAAFSAFTGRTILPSKNVQGTVTANIICQPWDVALKAVMNANGYDVTLTPDGILIVDTFENIASRAQTTQAMVPLNTRTVRLNYARAQSVANMVQVRLTRSCPPATLSAQQQQPQTGGGINIPNTNNQQPMPGQPVTQAVPQQQPQVGVVMSLQCPTRGAVTADTITNSISITDVPSALGDLEQYAHSLDIRQPQVNIKAKIILVDRSTIEGLGLRYDLQTRDQFFTDIVQGSDSAGNAQTAGQVALGGNMIAAIANATARVPSATLQLVYSTAMGNYAFTTFLEALQTNSLLDVQAEPSVTVLNNRTANITAGTQVPVRVIDAGSATGNAATAPRATVQMQQTGIILTVTPQITNNRQIQMRVHVENSDVQFQASDVGAVFPKQSVDNESLVADGETMVVGGLTQTSVTMSRTGLPLLIDLPIIGHLFGVTNRTETKRDLLILITPHIVDEGGQSPDSGRQ
jgi:type IV pilus assembly protein PilQ